VAGAQLNRIRMLQSTVMDLPRRTAAESCGNFQANGLREYPRQSRAAFLRTGKPELFFHHPEIDCPIPVSGG
jgi:hypothetical protein